MKLLRITRSFGSARAVDDVSLEIRSGEILAIVGENGAGKTTLMRIAAGELAPDSGTIDDSQRVALVHQHFMLVSELTIAENLALVDPRLRFATRKMLAREAERTIAESGLDLRDVSRRVADLSVGEKSKLELIKAVAGKPSTLILDEPTSVLTPPETEELFRVMHALAANGTAIVFISHKLPEVLAVADRIVVMRAGRVVIETTKAATDGKELANGMSPHPPFGHLLPASGEKGDDCPSPRLRGEGGRRPGEGILAIVGVAGNGQAELVAALRAQHDRRSMGLIPEDRTRDGIIAQMSIAENLALTRDRWNPRAAIRHAAAMIDLYSIRAQGPSQPAGDLSGGNQQKVVLARELDAQPEVIIAAEPTRGLDIEATAFVHERLRAAAAAGTRIVLITSDLDEAFALADSIQVIYRGKLSERMTPEEATTRVANLMAGVA